MCFHDRWFLIGWGLLLGLAELFNQTHRAALETTLEAATGTGVDELSQEVTYEISSIFEFGCPTHFDELN